MEPECIEVRHAREHNLRSVSVTLPRNALIVFTGVSGSGKSSLAFDTLYAEGQRRYIESLSSYARQFMGQLQKPDCDLITGLSPAISIQQKATGWNPRSTVGTVTAIHDLLRVLYARIGTQHCTACGRAITAQSQDQIIAGVQATFDDRKAPRIMILAPVARHQKGEFRDLFDDLIRDGYVRARVDGQLTELRNDLSLAKNQRHDIEVVIDRLTLGPQARSRLAEAVENGLRVGDGTVIVTRSGEAPPHPGGPRATRPADRKGHFDDCVFSSRYACTRCGLSFEPPTPQVFSFNSPAGMCPACDGLGELLDFDPDLLVPDPLLNFWGPCIAPMRTRIGRWRRHFYEGVARAIGCDLNRPWKELSQSARDALLWGTGDRHITFEWRWSRGVWRHGGTFEGVVAELRDKYRKTRSSLVRRYYEKYMRRRPCPDCGGARLTPQALAVRLPIRGARRTGPNLHELCAMNVSDALAALDRLALTPVQKLISDELLKEVRTRLQFLLDVGLHYLTLDRSAPTLSGGESQRIRLAGQIGSGLAGVLYVLDEPSIGLHARDNERLLESLKALRDMGNTVIVVEHDEATMRAADHVVDFGPGPGVRGGRIVAEGTPDEIAANKASLTGRYLCGEREIEVPKRRPVRPRSQQRRRRSGDG
ncbi:MAG: excinuclease ABC subunit UvrA [Phycisphaerae bacterium]